MANRGHVIQVNLNIWLKAHKLHWIKHVLKAVFVIDVYNIVNIRLVSLSLIAYAEIINITCLIVLYL